MMPDKDQDLLSLEARYFALGDLYYNNKNYDLALKEFNKALELNPRNDFTYTNLGQIYRDQRRYAESEKIFAEAIELNPKNDVAYAGLGHTYLRQKRFDLALESFNKALKINVKAGSAHQGLGIIYLERQLYNLAEMEFENALRFKTDNIYVHQSLGYAYKRNGKHDLAVKEFIKATDLCLLSKTASGELVDSKKNNEINLVNNQKIKTKILRMPSFSNKDLSHAAELNTSLLPPLALGQIVAYLRGNGIEIDQDDLNIKIHYDNYYSEAKEKKIDTSIFFDEDKISRYILGTKDRDLDSIMENVEEKSSFFGFDLILISFPIIFDNSSGFLFALALCRFLKMKYNPLIVAGGGNQSIELLNKRKSKDIDLIIYGDGENILLEFLTALKNNIGHKEFIASQVKENGKVIADKIYPPIKPDFSGLPIDMYKHVRFNSSFNRYSCEILDEFSRSETLLLPFKFIRGCPYECIFCPESTNKTIYVSGPEKTALYLSELQKEYKPAGFFFLSDTINISRQYINELCDEIIKSKIKVFWTDSARADNLDKDTILKMREAGCIRLILGMETASLKLLKYVDKRIALNKLENILKWADEAGIWTGLEIICGLPFEKDSDIEETIAFLDRNKDRINSLYFNQFGLRDGSILLQEAGKFGINNVIEINQYADEEFTYFHKYGYDESGGLVWQDKKKQILASQRKLLSKISWNVDFPVYEFEHFLFFLYNKFNKKNEICEAYNKVAGEKVNLLKKLSGSGKFKD